MEAEISGESCDEDVPTFEMAEKAMAMAAQEAMDAEAFQRGLTASAAMMERARASRAKEKEDKEAKKVHPLSAPKANSNSFQPGKISNRGQAKEPVFETSVPLPERMADKTLNLEEHSISISIQNGSLRCAACRKDLSNNRDTLNKHMAFVNKAGTPTTHSIELREWKTKQGKPTDIMAYLCARGQPPGCLPKDKVIAEKRVAFVRMLMYSGTPLSRVDGVVREYHEHLTGCKLGNLKEMYQTQTIIWQMMCEGLVNVFNRGKRSRNVSLLFDGTSRNGEVLAVVARFVEDDFTIRQLLIKVDLFRSTVNAITLAKVIMTAVERADIKIGSIVAFSHDRAATNYAALEEVQQHMITLNAVSLPCFSHSLNLAGVAIADNVGTIFSKEFSHYFQRSHKARSQLTTQQGVHAPPSHSQTRWWSLYEVQCYLLTNFTAVIKFIQIYDDNKSALLEKLKAMVATDALVLTLHLQLAVLVDSGRIFATTTYLLEGDGAVGFTVYRLICAVRDYVNDPTYPFLDVLLDDVDHVIPADREGCRAAALVCVEPMFDKFRALFLIPAAKNCVASLIFYEGMTVFTPAYTNFTDPEIRRCLKLLPGIARLTPALKVNVLGELMTELNQYKELATAFPCNVDENGHHTAVLLHAWWKEHGVKLKYWGYQARLALLYQPSEAAVERVFSRLQFLITKRQSAMTLETMEAILMLRCNGFEVTTGALDMPPQLADNDLDMPAQPEQDDNDYDGNDYED